MKMYVERLVTLSDTEEWKSIGVCDILYDCNKNEAQIIFEAYPEGWAVHTVNVFDINIGDTVNIMGTIKTAKRKHELFTVRCHPRI
jgi:hypothetical protein